MPPRGALHMHIDMICFKSAFSLGMHNQWAANISGHESKSRCAARAFGCISNKGSE